MRNPNRSVVRGAVATTAVALLAPVMAQAAAPTPGNILVYRGGDGTVEQAVNTTSVFIDEYTPAGALVQSFPAPTTGTTALSVGATTTTEGGLSISTDGNWAVFTGYRSDVGTAGTPQGKGADIAPRVIGRLNLATGVMDTDTVLTGQYTSSSIRGVASTDGTQFWTAGTSIPGSGDGSSGLVYTTGVGAAAVSTNLRSDNSRGVAIYDDTLYMSVSTQIRKVVKVEADPGAPGHANLPTMATVTRPNLLPANGSAYGQFVMFDLSQDIPGVDTMYAGHVGEIQKFSLANATDTLWTANGTVATGLNGNILGISGVKNETGGVTLYFTNVQSPTTASLLDTLTDLSGYNATITGSVTNLATALGNTSFRNVAVVPGSPVVLLPGDADGDGDIDLDDQGIWASNFTGSLEPGTGTGTHGMGDFDHDGDVDLDDQGIWASNFTGSLAPSALASVPEPASLGVVGAAVVGLMARRRRA